MNNNNFVILPGSKSGISVRLKAKKVRELQLEKVNLEMENKEMEKILQQLQSSMCREKEERKKSSAYHWKSGQAGPMAVQTRFLSRNKVKSNKVSSGKVKLQLLKEPIQEPVKDQWKHEMTDDGAQDKPQVKEMACGQCETKNKAEATACAGKLQAVDRFADEVNVNERGINRQKRVTSRGGVTSNELPSSPASAGTAEELSSESTWTGLDNQDKGILLNGIFNEEESAQSFQETLIQWRNGNDHRREQHAGEVLSESVGNREVQTNFSAMEEHVQIQFKEGGLSYMEKLLLKKYRRTSVDEMSGSCVKDLKPAQIRSASHEVVTAKEEQEDAGDTDDITVEEVRRYWTYVFREEVPKSVSESAESTLKIEFLDDSYDMGLEESRNFLVLEAESTGMNNQRNIEPFEEFGKCEKRRDNFDSGIAVQENTPPDDLPKETVSAMRKSSCHSSFTADNQYLSPFPLDGNLASKEILGGGGRWVTDRSLSEYADESVVQAVLEWQMSTSSGGLKTQNRISPPVMHRSYSGNDFIRPQSVDVLQHKLTGNGAKNTHQRPKSSPMHVFRADTEISKHGCIDVIKKDEYYWEHIADQEALISLEQELQTYIGLQEKLCSITSEDVTSSSRCSKMIYGNITDFYKTLELEGLSRADVLGGCDEDQTDDKDEVLEDKQQVLALQ